MKIKTEITYWCPHGFYCKNCFRIDEYEFGTYCNLYGPRLEKNANGNLLKCKECLLAEREQRIRGKK